MAVIMLYPLLLMFNISFKTYQEFLRNPTGAVDLGSITLANYGTVWKKLDFFRKAFNSIWYCLVAGIIACTIAVMAAYPLSRAHFKGSGLVFALILISMFLPGSLIANIILMNDILRIFGTRLNLLLLWGCGGVQFNILILVGFLKQLPRDLDEAAWVDGCPYFRYIFSTAVPLMAPIISTIFLLKFIGCWNDFLTPFIYLMNPLHRPLSTGLFFFKGQYASRWNELSAAIIFVAAPMVLLYVSMQSFIIKGLTSGALKG